MNWSLSHSACALGALLVAVHLPALFAPGGARRALQAFPRNDWSGWLLTALALTWTGLIVLHAPLGRFEPYKPALYVALPAAFLLIVVYLDELLAPRALGGVLLLAANPVLAAARWHPSALRLVVTVVAYIGVVAGIILVLSPYRFRQWTSLLAGDELRCRITGAAGLLLGGVLVLLGLTTY